MAATIPDLEGKRKSLARNILKHRELFPAVLIIVVGIVSFGLGRLSVWSSPAAFQKYVPPSAQAAQAGSFGPPEGNPAAREGGLVAAAHGEESMTATSSEALSRTVSASAAQTEKKYVGSKNSDKYHLPWCSGAARIAEENKVWFASKEEAEAAGYTPAANCKGI